MSFDTDFDKIEPYTTFDTENEQFFKQFGYIFLYKITITRLVIKFRCILKRTNKTSN